MARNVILRLSEKRAGTLLAMARNGSTGSNPMGREVLRMLEAVYNAVVYHNARQRECEKRVRTWKLAGAMLVDLYCPMCLRRSQHTARIHHDPGVDTWLLNCAWGDHHRGPTDNEPGILNRLWIAKQVYDQGLPRPAKQEVNP